MVFGPHSSHEEVLLGARPESHWMPDRATMGGGSQEAATMGGESLFSPGFGQERTSIPIELEDSKEVSHDPFVFLHHGSFSLGVVGSEVIQSLPRIPPGRVIGYKMTIGKLSRDDFGATWGYLGAILCYVGAILGPTWEVLGGTWAHLGV